VSDIDLGAINRRLQSLEDQIAIYQLVCGYGYAVDGCNGEAVGSFYAEDGVYSVSDQGYDFVGRAQIAGITTSPGHLELVGGGCAHMSTLPYVVIDGDRATATCHTTVITKAENGFKVLRLSASRLELSRKPEGGWQINTRKNFVQNGSKDGPALLARLKEGPQPLPA
jgi:hypothetical protein